MLSTIKRYFETHLAPDSAAASRDPQHAVRLAVAALMIEVTQSDHRQSSEEKAALLTAVGRQFGLETEEANTLIALAEKEWADSTDYFQFTRLLNQTYSPEQKIKVIEELWHVAFSDSELHNNEEHVIRRLADLIHVSHKDFIAAKHRVYKAFSASGR